MKKKQRGSNLQDSKENSTEKLYRLQHYMALCGVASRRASEVIIADGRVEVNDEKVLNPAVKVTLKDKVFVDGKQIFPEETKRYILLNKPAGYVCTSSDEKGRPIAADLLKSTYSERLYNVGRLDMFSSGLIIFTNDGEFARTLSHPSAELEKEYIVEASTSMPRYLASEFEKGVRIDNVFYKCQSCRELNSRKMRIVLIEGKNREIRKVYEHFNTNIKSLDRVRIGSVSKENLESGKFRELTQSEVKSLLKLCKKNETDNLEEY
ncbi:pseudouridine synthase [Treponema sp.]|uniref:pseudouridine synthase n=1 Tax=Treponema sp. TaxID=166 RepID=UPI00298DF0AD|nr:pseudouridine synthase [Treponema sp.]